MSDWRIVGDWGTTRLRLWRLTRGLDPERRDGPGIGALATSPAQALHTAIAPWLAEHGPPAHITLCGMAGARNGLHEAAYAECPAGVPEWRVAAARLAFEGIALTIAAGCASARDVMRGEETQVYGALARVSALGQGPQLVLLPGTHSKWVRLENGRITALDSVITGELYALLCNSSLFATGSTDASDEADPAGFTAGLAHAQTSPGVLAHLFQARVAQLRQGRSAGWARGLLSGLLIGGEVAEMHARGDMPAHVTLIGDPALAARYTEALAAHHIATTRLAGDDCVLAGLELLDADA